MWSAAIFAVVLCTFYAHAHTNVYTQVCPNVYARVNTHVQISSAAIFGIIRFRVGHGLSLLSSIWKVLFRLRSHPLSQENRKCRLLVQSLKGREVGQWISRRRLTECLAASS